jgi:lipoprotein-anchoring transpeptidase ErfK/SrfK
MTFNNDQQRSHSTLPTGRSRSLFWVVIVGIIVMVLLVATITALFFQELVLEDRLNLAGKQTDPLTLARTTPDQFKPLVGQPLATETAENFGGNESPSPTATEERAYLLQPKQILAGSPKNRAGWTATPIPTNTPTPTPSPVPTFVSDESYSSVLRPESIGNGEKWIDVNLTSQTLVAFEGNAPVFQSLVSSGTAKHPTVTGQFRIWLRFSSQDMNGRRLGYDYFLKDVPYVQYFYQDYALHGTFWHNNFGTPMSHGCVNLPTPSAEWLFNWASSGTLVNVHN